MKNSNSNLVPACPYCGENHALEIVNTISGGKNLGDGSYFCRCTNCNVQSEPTDFKKTALADFFSDAKVYHIKKPKFKCNILSALKNIFN